MSKDEQSDDKAKPEDKSLQELSLELNFVPEWARKSPETSYFNSKPSRNTDTRDNRQGSRGRPQGGRPQSRDNRGRDQRPQQRKGPQNSGPRQRQGQQQRVPYRDKPERIELAPVDIRFIPLQKAISEIGRKISSSRRAYPLMQIAHLYLDNPETCNARVEVRGKNPELLQCKLCGMIALKQDTLNSHMVKEHLEDFMIKEETEGEVPTGSFSCVAQCGFSGTLLGPPNHHSYAEKIAEMHSQGYQNMSLEDYKRRIKTVHEEEAVEKWKQEFAHRVTYRPKDDEDAKPLSRVKAEALFIKTIAPGQTQKTRRATLSVPMCRDIGDAGLLLTIKNTWLSEFRFPKSIMTALRGAYKSKGLTLFKAGKGKGVTFVTSIPLAPIKLENVVDNIKIVMNHLIEHPGSSRVQLLESLRPDATEEERKEILAPLGWLIERGHIIEFFDGTLSVPSRKRQA